MSVLSSKSVVARSNATKQSRILPPHKNRLLRRVAPFHEPDLTDASFKNRLPLTPTPLPTILPLPLCGRVGVRVGVGLRPVQLMVRGQYRPRRYRQLAMTVENKKAGVAGFLFNDIDALLRLCGKLCRIRPIEQFD